ncbi:MAG: hypothetical protein QOC94_3792 [Actinoplanes sp.]|jgi:hypothetical protein|nr:hypothetical protein [Actinoplanes sp.]
MPDVIDILHNLPQATAAVRTDVSIVTADLARGHQAVTRRHRKRVGFAAAAVAAIAVVAVGAGQLGTPANTRPTAAGGSSVPAPAVHLAAYAGDQPPGFIVTTVPDGWTVLSSNEGEFVVAPPGQETGGGPSTGPSTGPQPVEYTDRIAVYLHNDAEPAPTLMKEPAVKTVDINGNKAKLGSAPKHQGETSPTRMLLYRSGKNSVVVQVPASTGLDDDQIIFFARGITVTKK